MNRREFLASGLAGPLIVGSHQETVTSEERPFSLRERFPRMKQECYLNAASIMPLSEMAQSGLERYMTFQQLGNKVSERAYIRDMWRELRGQFAQLIGAQKQEIGLVHCTKAGEQIALDAVDHIKPGGKIVTNDLHFSGSLHNLLGMRKAGRPVEIIRAENWRVPLKQMIDAIDDKTAMVTVSLVSNINGHIEDIDELVKHAHKHGALVYADIVQAAGVLPIDVTTMGFDLAACSCYKWLYGVYGTGFVYVRETLQGHNIPDHLFPGRVHYNYAPWTEEIDPSHEPLGYQPPKDASRYEPGHVNYMGYCAAYESLKMLLEIGIERVHKHTVDLNKRLLDQLDPKRYPCISTHVDRSPIITFTTTEPEELHKKLDAANLVVTQSENRIRVSPALYNTTGDIDQLAAVMNG